MKRITMIMIMMTISTVLFVAQCVEFLKDHSFWEMVTSPIQFWTGNYALAALGVALITLPSWQQLLKLLKKAVNV